MHRLFLPAGLAVIVLLGAMVSTARAQQRTVVTGIVTDSAGGAPVPLASVEVEGTFAGTAADGEGRYRIALAPGSWTLRFRALGYETTERTLDVRPGATVQLDVALAPAQLQLGSITVEAERGAAEVDPSLFRLRPQSATHAPALGEPDVMRVAALLPGITQANDLRSGLNVRGGAADQNQFLLDGIEVYNPNHLVGLFSAFNLWALSDMQILAGGFPARYGGRLSSVVALETRVPPADSAYAKANLSLVSAGGAYARRFGTTGVTVAARRTYADPVLAAIGQDIRYNFYDANLKVTHPLGNGFSVEVLGFTNRDALGGNPDGDMPMHFDWGNRLAALRLKREAQRWRHRLTASYVHNFAGAHYGDSLGYVDNTFEDVTARYQGEVVLRRSRLAFGASAKRLSTENAWDGRAFSEDFEELFYPGAPELFAEEKREPLYSAYLSGETYLTSRLALQSGLRYSRLGATGEGALQPRTKLSFEMNETWTFTAGAGRYAQHVAEGAEGKEFTVQQPTFLLETPQTAWTASAGAVWTPSTRYRLSAEVYGRRFDRFTRLGLEVFDREKISAVGLDPGEGRPFPGFVGGEGVAYGLDLFLQKTRGWITGQLAYSFTHTRLNFGAGRYPPGWSIPHSLQGLVGLRVGPWRLGVAGTLRSGLPYTPVVGHFYGPGADPVNLRDQYLLGDRNSERFPFYARMDLSLRRTYSAERFDWTLYLQALNLLNRTNALRIETARYYNFGIDHQGDGTPAGLTRSLPVIPSAGIEFTF